MTNGLFQDGPIMAFIDAMMIVTSAVSLSFMIKFMIRTRFETSPIGRLIVANSFAWLLLATGLLLYRVHMPETAQWVLLPLAIGVPAVTLWWHAVLDRSRRTRGELAQLLDRWYAEGARAAGEGQYETARVTFQRTHELGRIIRVRGRAADRA